MSSGWVSDLAAYVSKYANNFTTEDVCRYIRIAIYYSGGYAVGHGWATHEEIVFAAGIGMGVGNFVWTVWGMRFKAKLTELAKMDHVEHVTVTSAALADSIPSAKVTT